MYFYYSHTFISPFLSLANAYCQWIYMLMKVTLLYATFRHLKWLNCQWIMVFMECIICHVHDSSQLTTRIIWAILDCQSLTAVTTKT